VKYFTGRIAGGAEPGQELGASPLAL
jgi:hypothetical protein